MYSALGQAIIMMNSSCKSIKHAIAVQDLPEWNRQITKIPERVKEKLNLQCFLVSSNNVKQA